jgi:hypothetical protein
MVESRTLQQEIDYQVSPSGGSMKTFIIRDKDGDCSVPAFTNVRLINCKIYSLNIKNSSIIYFKDCTIRAPKKEIFSLLNSAILAEHTIWDASVVFTNCKIEFSNNCSINRNILLKDFSYLKSVSNTWKSVSTSDNKIALMLSNNCKVDSFKDIWAKWDDYFWKVENNSIVKITNPIKIDHSETSGSGKGLALLDNSSVVVISHVKEINIKNNINSLFTCTKNSRVELYNLDSIISKSTIFNLNFSKAIIRNINTLNSDSGIIDIIDSYIEFSNIPIFKSTNNTLVDLFKAVNSTITFSNTNSCKTGGSIFNLDNCTVNFISKSFDPNSEQGAFVESANRIAVKANNSKIFVKNLQTLNSNSNQAIDLINTSFEGVNIVNINAGSTGGIITGDHSYLKLRNIKSISGFASDGIYLKYSKGIFSNINTIENKGGLSFGLQLESSSVICKDIITVTGQDTGISLKKNSVLIFKSKGTKINGNSKNGIFVGAGCRLKVSDIDTIYSRGNGIGNTDDGARIELKDVRVIDGAPGIYCSGADITVDNSGLSLSPTPPTITGIVLLSNAALGTYKATLIGPISINSLSALRANKYIIEEQGIKWNGDINTYNCIVKKILSDTSGRVSSINSDNDYLRTSVGQDLSLENSTFKLANSSIVGEVKLNKSVLDSVFSTLGKATLTSKSMLAANTSIINGVSLTDSFLGAFSTVTGKVTLVGASSALGGASQGADINFLAGDVAYSNPIAYFVTSKGNLSFQADNTIIMEAINGSIIESSKDVVYTGTERITTTVGGSSIVINSSSITITSGAVNIN